MHRYSEEEKEIVREIWASPVLLKQQMDRLPGRTPWSVQRQATVLELGPKNHSESPLYERICVLMDDKEARTVKEIAAALFASQSRTNKLLRKACDSGEFHIAKYRPRPVNGTPTPVFRKGKGRNARRATVMTLAERARKFRMQVDPVEYAFKRRKYALNRKIKLGRVRPGALSNALFGRASA